MSSATVKYPERIKPHQLRRRYPQGLTAPKLGALIGLSGRSIAQRLEDGRLPCVVHSNRKRLIEWHVIDLIQLYGLLGVEVQHKSGAIVRPT